MAELSILWETVSGTGDSSTSGYTDTLMFQLFRSLFSRTANLGGVTPDFQNELAVTGASSPVAVNTGAGLVYGIPYFNSASVNVVIATPGASTRVDRIVLRASWAAKTVRITRIAGTEGAGAPAMTQIGGTTWDIPLATVSITTGAVITVTDGREWLDGAGDGTIDSTKLATGAVTTAKIAASAVGASELATSAVTTAKIADDAVTAAKLSNMAQDTIRGRITASTGDPEDLSATNVRTIINVANGADVTSATNIASSVVGSSAKTTPIDADSIALIDSAASNALKKVTIANLRLVTATAAKASFTPTYLVAGSETGVTYGLRNGQYLVSGEMVFVSIHMELTNKGAGSGAITIGGLPFSVVSPAASMAVNWHLGTTSLVHMSGLVLVSGTTITLYGMTAAATSSLTSIQNSDMSNTSRLYISGSYFKAA